MRLEYNFVSCLFNNLSQLLTGGNDTMLPVTVIKQGVALTGRNRTGPPCNVGRPTTHAPGSVTDDDDRR